MTPYKLPLKAAEAEFTEKKSRFIGHITPAQSEREALSFLRSIRTEHSDATHNVYAYRLRDGGISRHSDDGEPSGTAGAPLLDVFVKQDIYDFCCVATRYFGGVKLGAGGLVRAYTRCGVIALETAGIGEMRELTLCAMTAPYARYEHLKRIIHANGGKISSEDFGPQVELEFSLAPEDVPALMNMVAELSAGEQKVRIAGSRMSVRSP